MNAVAVGMFCSVCQKGPLPLRTFPDAGGLWWIEDPYDLDVHGESVWRSLCPDCWSAACDDI